ncbi:MAG: Transcription-repair-coupling factor [Syntrophaceae bacterium PtaB.Bin038]|nr:MAG: Transcription-repair-coupling factor [Syntrophaceae bacterium PtaB.Bin038]
MQVNQQYVNPEFHKLLQADPGIRAALERIGRGEEARVTGLRGSSKALFLAALHALTRRTTAVLCAGPDEARSLAQDAAFFAGDGAVLLMPPWDLMLPDTLSPQRDVERERIRVLCALTAKTPSLVIIPRAALLQRVVPRAAVAGFVSVVSIGDTLDRDLFASKLAEGGYRRVPLVEEGGDFSVRGNVIDLYPPTAPCPYRLLLAGDEIESIREMDVSSQRSRKELAEFTLTPARELILSEEARKKALRNLRIRAGELGLPARAKDRLAEMIANGLASSLNPQFFPLFYMDEAGAGGLEALTDYLPADALVVADDPLAAARADERARNEISRLFLRAQDEEKFHLEEGLLFLGEGDPLRAAGRSPQIVLEDIEMGAGEEDRAIRVRVETDLGLRPKEPALIQREESLLAPVAERIRVWTREGFLVCYLCAGEEERLRMSHLLEDYALPLAHSERPFFGELCAPRGAQGRLVLCEGKIAGGFALPGLKLVVVGEEEIFGKKARRRRPARAREGWFLQSFGELNEGDFVVHTDHGIGIYRGLKRLSVGAIENDFLLMEYQGGDRLYIPVHRLDQIQRYIGPDGHEPRIDRLGGTAWETAKRRVKKAAEEIAEDLVALYAARDAMKGHAFSAVDRYYEEFASSFEYEETPDQARAIEDVNLDMDGEKPMDRLICGDAGFGKTEVAVRAAFRAAMDGKQTAVLVPTTILAEQHYQTFQARLAKYPVRIETLNRFKTREQQKQVIEKIAKGTVDIVVGTHRLLQKDVVFKDLGLVVIDEEQRFGVTHKEKLKKLRTLVDVLTLTATPIPRTLQLSLVGIRDLSVIHTPPEGRLSIKTWVLEFDDEVIRKAILDEMDRGGQVFFIHDRVHSIHHMARRIRQGVPEAKIGVAHGQMPPRELEEVMVKFLRKEFDVLICTTIIGSGIDVPAANTIIIDRADRFGLAQLYQIRGRVGRSKEEARAYLLIPPGAMLSPDAQKRLTVIKEFTEPGSGFRIASQDLEIRGAGNLMGMAQSGHISAVGYEMYTQLMERAVRELRGDRMPEAEIKPEIHLGLAAFVPDSYVPDTHRRLVTYKKLSMAASDEELAEMRDEMQDCYGPLPREVESLVGVISLRNLMKGLMAEKMEYDGHHMILAIHRASPIDPLRLVALAKKKWKGMRFTPDHRLYVPMPDLPEERVIEAAKGLLGELAAQ